MHKTTKRKLHPDLMVQKIQDISLEALFSLNVKGIILDVDNTLLSRSCSSPSPEVLSWVRALKKHFNIILLSNNIPIKIQRASIPLELPYIAWTLKPIPCYFKKATRYLKLDSREVCMIGDQLFTDILGAKIVGAKTIYVNPIDRYHESFWTKCIRVVEKRVIQNWMSNP